MIMFGIEILDAYFNVIHLKEAWLVAIFAFLSLAFWWWSYVTITENFAHNQQQPTQPTNQSRSNRTEKNPQPSSSGHQQQATQPTTRPTNQQRSNRTEKKPQPSSSGHQQAAQPTTPPTNQTSLNRGTPRVRGKSSRTHVRKLDK